MPVNSSGSAGTGNWRSTPERQGSDDIVAGHGSASRSLLPQQIGIAAEHPEGRASAVVIAISVVLIITSVLMVLLVLLHKGKGGGLSDLFGGGMSSSLGSSSVVERNLDRLTIFTGVIWFLCIIALNFLLNH